jgi:UDP-3-O-[3-hydroxymyristoyl] glucosamine N-acyltransferase
MNKIFFSVDSSKYDADKSFLITCPASLDYPKDNSVMFITEKYMSKISALFSVKNCLIFFPRDLDAPHEVSEKNVVVNCENPHLEFCRFFSRNNITSLPDMVDVKYINGSFLSHQVTIGNDTKIFPGSYLAGEIQIGKNVYIGSGVRIIGQVSIGDNVVVRENCVIGADGLSTDRDEHGKALTMPQFGGVIIDNDVQIGANTVICRGAIDNTIIKSGCKIDNSCFISHNVILGADTFIVGETIMFGSSSTGEQVFISGNATIRNKIHIGSKALVGMGAVVVSSVPDGAVVKGNPAK